MNARDISLVAFHEMRQQSRRWEFRFFVFFSLVGVTLCHVYWLNYSPNWKVMALPCSVPLMNAYLFSVVQSLFAILMITDLPRRERSGGALECVFARPVNNTDYMWGKILGNVLLFMLVNVAVILPCLLFVHPVSPAPYEFGYYLFYMLTLNLPALVFVTGLSFWLTRLVRLRFPVMIVLYALLVVSIMWLPYRWHGTFDFLGSGLPNLFSDVTGHVGLTNYLFHRVAYFLLGIGFLFWSVRGMSRLPNSPARVRRCVLVGILPVAMAFVGLYLIEASYAPAREVRSVYRECFREYWREGCCRVNRHDIVLQSSGDTLSASSDLTLYNPNGERVEKLVLFLNPGLRVESLTVAGESCRFLREGQIVSIDYPLVGGDSVRLSLRYGGRIDERFTDLHLRDSAYEDSFRGDRFFPTGRRGAFVSDGFLLLTPACAWYPVTIPPVNPEIPAYTGRDFTRFRLTVVNNTRKVLCSQGIATRRGDSCFFQPSCPLSGVSLCGGDYELHQQQIPGLTARLYTFKKHMEAFPELDPMSRKEMHNYLSHWVYAKKPNGWADRDWYERENPVLHMMEVPLPFITEAVMGKMVTGQVEPGMVFLAERGFDFMYGFSNDEDDSGEPGRMFRYLVGVFNKKNDESYNSHPLLGLGAETFISRRLNPYQGFSLLEESGLWIKSEEFPLVGCLFDRLMLNKGVYWESFFQGTPLPEEMYEMLSSYLAEHSLHALFQDDRLAQYLYHGAFRLKEQELVDHFALEIPMDTLLSAYADVCDSFRGEMDIDIFDREMSQRLGRELRLKEILGEWLHAENRQFFKVTDLEITYSPTGRMHSLDGRHLSPTEWMEVKGKVMNCGKTGGFVSVTLMGFMSAHEEYRRACYLKPGEAKSFYAVQESLNYFGTASCYTGLSLNRPRLFYFDTRYVGKVEGLEAEELRWMDVDTAEFSLSSGEVIVDNVDRGFSLEDPNVTWLQRWFGKPVQVRSFLGSIPSRWTPSVDVYYHGDSVRSCYFKGFGTGKHTATWRTTLSTGGRYRMSAKVSRRYIDPLAGVPKGVVYHYVLRSVAGEERVSVELDPFFHDRQWEGWVTLGDFDFPAGEVSVTLSDYDELGRDYIAVVADAVKWERVGD